MRKFSLKLFLKLGRDVFNGKKTLQDVRNILRDQYDYWYEHIYLVEYQALNDKRIYELAIARGELATAIKIYNDWHYHINEIVQEYMDNFDLYEDVASDVQFFFGTKEVLKAQEEREKRLSFLSDEAKKDILYKRDLADLYLKVTNEWSVDYDENGDPKWETLIDRSEEATQWADTKIVNDLRAAQKRYNELLQDQQELVAYGLIINIINGGTI